MEVLVNADGTRNRVNRPYIDQEELKRNLVLYDPNGYNLGTGLYDRPQPMCERWVDHFHQHVKRSTATPAYIVDRRGRNVYPNTSGRSLGTSYPNSVNYQK